MSSNRPLNVGIIGYGLSAKVFHIPFIQASANLALHSIVQRNPPASPTLAGTSAPLDHPSAKHHRTTDPLLSDPEVDIIIVTTPPNSHFALTEAALRAGKHVLVEKPFVPTSAEAATLARISEETGRFVCVFQNRRWDVDFLTVRSLLASGKLGDRVVEFETHFDRYRPNAPTGTWKADLPPSEGGGLLYDLGSHLLDQVYVLFGLPATVYAKMPSQRADGTPDSLTALLSYDSGLLVHVRAGVMSAEAKQLRFWARGSGGSYKKYGMDPQEATLRSEGGSVTDPSFGVDPEPGTVCVAKPDGSMAEETFTVPPAGYGSLLEGFAGAIRSGKREDIPVSAQQAADVLKIVEAVRESATSGREVKL
ncbi:related to oxidoreductase [Cephalotrichum gorgonifer]|uniref:Related to oxidoreductase n=1 Tax=Cephalotrichum gorgonifer TaxID=2041049 RepID=A0AAE8SSL6_9PEZI|nr:related to oxidoreductase [Cephalotrichum gorgonifer]